MLLFSLTYILILLGGIFLAILCVKISNEKKQEKNFRKKVLKIKKQCLKQPKSEESAYLLRWIDYHAKKGFSKCDYDFFKLEFPCNINYTSFIIYTLIEKYNYEDIIKRMDIIREICYEKKYIFRDFWIKQNNYTDIFYVSSTIISRQIRSGDIGHACSCGNIFEMCETRLKEKNK